MQTIRDKGNFIFCALFSYLVATSFINQDVYAFTVRYASLIIFAVLGILALPYLAEDLKNKDTDLLCTVLTVVLSVICAVLSHSGFGAVLIPSDLALICYMSGRLRFSEKTAMYIAFAGACPVILWYSHVRWSYNFNMAGFAFMLMAFFGMLLIEMISETDLVDIKYKGFIEFMIFLTGFILSMLYHSRTAMFGMAVFAVIYLTYGFMSTCRWLYRLIFMLASIGAVLFTAVYIRLASVFGDITLLYKDIFSGRQAIWRELWRAFLQSPAAGIGSAYQLESFEIFEVHNGMFDILVVHGIPVFTLVVIMLWRTFGRMFISGKTDSGAGLHKLNQIRRIAIPAAFAMMFTSYFENFFTVPPYSVIFMSFLLIAGL
ncbi:MAG: O-antigen ligase family protein [Lachnospiraceae bacterium]|nr:O-antigen ligase family protein [Lachnospiraceae bacterium]